MKYTSALFLVLLLAPFAFTQSDVLELIERSPEGKEVLDNILLDVSLSGDRINVANLRSRVNKIYANTQAYRKSAVAALDFDLILCKTNLQSAKGRFHDFTERALWSKRTLSLARREQKKRAVVLERASENFEIADRFMRMAKESAAAWKKFWNTGSQSFKKIASLLSQVRSHVRRLHKAHAKAALVQLPTSYTDALTELTTQFDSSIDNLGGLRPIIANLLEVLRSPTHLEQQQVRESAANLISKLAYHLHDVTNLYEEENAHQKALFASLIDLFQVNAATEKRVISAVTAAAKSFAKKLQWLTESVTGSAQFAAHSKTITDMMMTECRALKHNYHAVSTSTMRILQHVEQVREVIADRWNSVASYFIEKSESQRKTAP